MINQRGDIVCITDIIGEVASREREREKKGEK